MGEFVGHTDFYGITVNWESIFTEDVLEHFRENEEINLIECIQENLWKEYDLEKPFIFVLCEELKLDVTIVCTTDKIGSMYLNEEDTAIAIGKIITGSTIRDRISSLYEAERDVTHRKINEIIEILELDENNYMSTLRLETYYLQG